MSSRLNSYQSWTHPPTQSLSLFEFWELPDYLELLIQVNQQILIILEL
jgi:hypothetical protein